MKQLLIIWHSMTGGSRTLADAAFTGAKTEKELNTRLLHADEVTAQDMLDSDGYLFAFPENLAAISGVMKAAFDRLYYPCLGKIEGRPYALIVCAGSDGSNAVSQTERIAKGWRLKKVTDSQIICTHAQTQEAILAPKIISQNALQSARDTGNLLAAGIAAGIY